MKKMLMVAFVALMVAGVTSTANALPLLPDGIVGITDVAPTGGFTTHVITDFTTLVSYDSIVATITQNVYLNSTGYLFLYGITRSDSVGNAIHRFTTTDFDNFTTDVNAYRTVSTDDLPHFADRSNTGDSIGFSSENLSVGDFGISPGVNSAIYWVQTNAQYLGMGTGNFINGGIFTTPLYCPAVPEPASMLMFGTGLIGLLGVARRKFAA